MAGWGELGSGLVCVSSEVFQVSVEKAGHQLDYKMGFRVTASWGSLISRRLLKPWG